MKANRINHGDLRTLTPAQAITYLEQRGEQVGQKTLDMERQAIQAMMIHVTQTLPAGEHLPVVKSEQAQILSSRAYSPDQVALIAAAQQPANALATAIALAAGLRAHELLTLAPRQERAADPRPAADSKFAGREGVIYTVQGKGGLVREVLLPSRLAERLEHVRLASPVRVTDRGVFTRVSTPLAEASAGQTPSVPPPCVPWAGHGGTRRASQLRPATDAGAAKTRSGS